MNQIHGCFMQLAWVWMVAACTPPPPIPPELQDAPAGEGPFASISGSRHDGFLLDDPRAYVLAVDGKRVMAGPEAWERDLPIAAGERTIAVAFDRNRGAESTHADLTLDAVAGQKYQVRFSTDARLLGATTYCDFWIVNMATQKPVTGIARGSIRGVEMTPIPVPAW